MGPPDPLAGAARASTALELFRQMLLIRRFEEEAARAYSLGKIGGFLHLYIGQEAVCVGACAALRPGDHAITTYRDHALALTRGTSARSAMAELFGKAAGCSRGLGGSMHFFDVERRMWGGHGIVGSHLPLAAGLAFASKYRGDGHITAAFYGEGAASIGATHEAMSLASLWKLPIVFVCENNQYSMGTPLARQLSVHDVSLKAAAYGMPRDRFEAEDVLEVRDRLAVAFERARTGEGPTLVECVTYRYRGHSMSDPAKYRTAEEVEDHKRRDPLERLRRELAAAPETAAALAQLEAQVEDEVADALRFAEESPEPGPELLESATYKGAFAR